MNRYAATLAFVFFAAAGTLSASDKWHYQDFEKTGHEASGCASVPVMTLFDDRNRQGNHYKLTNYSASSMRATRKYKKQGGSSAEEKTWRNEARSAEYLGRWELCRGEGYDNCTTFDSKVMRHDNLSQGLDQNVSSVRLLGCYDSRERFKAAELPSSMKICITTVIPGYSGSQTVEIRAADKDGNTLGNACEMAVGGGESCCDTGYRGFRDPERIHFDIKSTSSSAKMREVSKVTYTPRPGRYAEYGREDGGVIEAFAGVWLKEHTMCGMGFFKTCESADGDMFGAKYDIFDRFAIGTDRACREGFIEVDNYCDINNKTGYRVVCKKVRNCTNAQSR